MQLDPIEAMLVEPILSGSKAAEVILAVGPLAEGKVRETLEIGVHNAALNFAMSQLRVPISSEERVADAEALADACRMVLVQLGLTIEGRRKDKTARKPVQWRSIKRSLGPGALYTGGPDALSAIEGVQELERMAERIAAHYQSRVTGTGKPKGAKKNMALGPLFRDLEELYFGLWDDVPALTSSSAQGNWREAWREAEQANSVVGEAYATGAKIPTRFLRLLCEVFPLLLARGLDVPVGPGAIERACRRWRADQMELAARREGEESLYDLGKRLSRELRGPTGR